MTVQRATGIVLSLYHRLIENGLEPHPAMYLTHMLSHSNLFLKHKEKFIDIIAADVADAWEILQKNYIISPNDPDNKDMEIRESEMVGLLEDALALHYEPEQSVGY